MAAVIQDEVDFRPGNSIRKKERSFHIDKMVLNQEDITIVSIYSPNNRALKYMKLKLIKTARKKNRSTMIGEYSNSLPSKLILKVNRK